MPARVPNLLRLAQASRTDGDLLRAHLAGTPAAFAELTRRHADLARRVAAEVCPAAADDVAQATLALPARKAATVAGRESAAGWVFETARRLALKARTADARRSARERRARPAAPARPARLAHVAEVRAAVAEECPAAGRTATPWWSATGTGPAGRPRRPAWGARSAP